MSSSSLAILNKISFLGGTLKQYVEGRMTNGKGPVLEKTWLDFWKNIFQVVKFLHEEVGMAHNDIHGNSFHQNHLRSEVMITIHITDYLLILLLLLLLLLAAIHRSYAKIAAFKLFFCSYSK